MADPTAGLANLAQEAKSQDELNKQQRQRYAAVRQALAVKGLMGKVGVKSTSGGNIEITGAEGGMSDSDAKKAYYEIGDENDGIVGKGKTSVTTVDDSLMKGGLARQADAKATDSAQSIPTQTAVASMVAGKVPKLTGLKSAPFDLDKFVSALSGRNAKAEQAATDAATEVSQSSVSQATPLSPQMMQQKNALGTISPSAQITPPMAPTNSNPAVTASDPNVTGTEKLPEIPKLDVSKEGDGTTTGAILSHGPYQSELGQQVSVNAAKVATNPAPVTAGGVSSSSSRSISAGGSESESSSLAVDYKGLHNTESGHIGVSTNVETNDGGTIVDNVRMSRRDLMAAQLDADSQSNAWGGQKTSVFDNAIAQKNAINQAVNQALQSRYGGTKQEYVGSYNTAYSGASYDGSASKNMAQQNNITVGDRTTNNGGGANDNNDHFEVTSPFGTKEDIQFNKKTGNLVASLSKPSSHIVNNFDIYRYGPLGSPQFNQTIQKEIDTNPTVKGWTVKTDENGKTAAYAPGAKTPSLYYERGKSSETLTEKGNIQDALWDGIQNKKLGGIISVTYIDEVPPAVVKFFSKQSLLQTKLGTGKGN